ncbi:mas-related G-protein coupled receptor member H-like [Phascolarctos cinereus]|uniref:Mas-related G-protein coupled receptor member H-like n=1 Tax=Phascolarctos cinereus TaxID=38626 RepID=A0A6P5IW72_PHACI|nr:mas-related G-protein coupled receptor member H-like [Phascolarctos cinereus]
MTCNDSSNGSQEITTCFPKPDRDTEPHITIFFNLITCLCGLLGNGVVFWFLSFHIKRSHFTIYILNLTVADFSFLLGRIIWYLAKILYIYTSKLLTKCHMFYICHGTLVFNIFVYNTGLGFLMVISVERCLSMLFPLWYRYHRLKKKSSICAFIWSLSVFMAVLEFYFEIYMGDTYKTWRYIISIFSCVLNFLVSTPLMVLSSLILFLKSWQQPKQHHPAKLHITILVTILMFLLFGLPQKVWFVVHFGFKVAIHRSISIIFELLSCINSSANPAIYFFVGNLWKNKKRRSLKLTLLRAFKEDFQRTEDGMTLPATKSEIIGRRDTQK